MAEAHVNEPDSPSRRPRFALALGGGAARGLAHIGVLEVLEREGLRPCCIVGTSMGALAGALWAAGIPSEKIAELACDFRFPPTFILGGLVRWDALFGSCLPALQGTFEQLQIPLYITAVNLERGNQVIMHRGPLLPAVRASSSVPGIMSPVHHGADWLVDGGLVNVLPVDVCWLAEPDFVVAVDLSGPRMRRLERLDQRLTTFISHLGEMIPNPATAKVSLEVMIRATEILLDRQTTLSAAMTAPDVLIQPSLGDLGLREFDRIVEAIVAGRSAAEAALPKLRQLLDSHIAGSPGHHDPARFHFDPVCAMVITPATSRATVVSHGHSYHFCSLNCRDSFVRTPNAYLKGAS